MSGEKNLAVLLRDLNPVLHQGEFVFSLVEHVENLDLNELVCWFREEEGITIIVSRNYADRIGLNYSFVASWITLKIHSSLEAVGLTAAFSKALADEGIGCNVVAAFYHDHIFVNWADSAKAIQVLKRLSH